jgi:hypothetical protein
VHNGQELHHSMVHNGQELHHSTVQIVAQRLGSGVCMCISSSLSLSFAVFPSLCLFLVVFCSFSLSLHLRCLLLWRLVMCTCFYGYITYQLLIAPGVWRKLVAFFSVPAN